MQTQKVWTSWITFRTPLFACLLLGILVFIFCLFGIYSRPISHYSVFWPANALLVGLLIRFPQLRQPLALFGAFLGYLWADLLTGNTLLMTLVLTLLNFINVFVSLWVLEYLQYHLKPDQSIGKGIVPYLSSSIIGGFSSAFCAVIFLPHIPNTFLEQGQFWKDLFIWWTGEILNYILIVPICLAFPSAYKKLIRSINLADTIPFAAIMISVISAYLYFGPATLLYPLAALVWAASIYRVFTVAVINCVMCLTIYHSVGEHIIQSNPYDITNMILSVRIGLITLSITAMILCLTSRAKKRMFQELHYSANHDSLTAALNRRCFLDIAEKRLNQPKVGRTLALIMLDIDFFKRFNDEYGHHAGDLVLRAFANIIQKNIRTHDLFCRMGGEEFVIFMENITPQDALKFANRLREIIAQTGIPLEQEEVFVTVSMGIKTLTLPSKINVQQLLNYADHALYQAKADGRNRVRMAC